MASANAISQNDLAAIMRSFIRSDLLLIEDHSRSEARNCEELLTIAEGLEGVTSEVFIQAAVEKLGKVLEAEDEQAE